MPVRSPACLKSCWLRDARFLRSVGALWRYQGILSTRPDGMIELWMFSVALFLWDPQQLIPPPKRCREVSGSSLWLTHPTMLYSVDTCINLPLDPFLHFSVNDTNGTVRAKCDTELVIVEAFPSFNNVSCIYSSYLALNCLKLQTNHLEFAPHFSNPVFLSRL